MDLIRCAELCEDSYKHGKGFRSMGDLRYGIVRDKDQTYLVFRGTANLPNGIRDVLCWPAETSTQFLAHKGFVSAFDMLQPSICNELPLRGRHDIIATGHSLGAAIALLFGEYFGCRVVTFGCPRVYFRFGVQPDIKHVRIVCDDDPVPMIPHFLYKHLNAAHVMTDADGFHIDVEDHGMHVYSERLQAEGLAEIGFV